MPRTIAFQLNGRPVTLSAEPSRLLLWALRADLGLTGTKYGCGIGACGACTVVVGGAAVRACETPLEAVQGKEVTTIEGLERDGKLHPLQEAFIEHGAFQCGYCTPGMIMTAHALLLQRPGAARAAILEALEGHLCRCGAHARIVTAVEAVAHKGGRP
jgi:aerobic-type carbon monoxide dehydrogenase small subunit (CoxS/CutS family)